MVNVNDNNDHNADGDDFYYDQIIRYKKCNVKHSHLSTVNLKDNINCYFHCVI